MDTKIYLKATDSSFNATGQYTPDKTIVFKGSIVRLVASKNFKGADIVVKFRNDKSIVDSSGNVLCDCSFSSPSTAAQFVTGRIANGYIAWRVDEKNNLGKFLERKKTKGSKQSY